MALVPWYMFVWVRNLLFSYCSVVLDLGNVIAVDKLETLMVIY